MSPLLAMQTSIYTSPKMLPKLVTVVVVLAAILVASAQRGLSDEPIVGDALQQLDGSTWIASNGQLTIAATVPGDLITDLERAGVIGDPLYNENWLLGSNLWDGSSWTYSTSFNLDFDPASYSEVFLVFDGIKMAADIYLNDQALGGVNDQFLRWSIPVHAQLINGLNQVNVTFPINDKRNDEGRFMACSGGWDWAPYSNTFTPTSHSHTFTKGIWKSVYLVYARSAVISYVVPQVFYTGTYPTAPLPPVSGPFEVRVRVYFDVPSQTTGSLRVWGEWNDAGSVVVAVNLGAGTNFVEAVLPAASVRLWWPAGLGEQVRYNVGVAYTPTSGGATLTASRRIGFRVFNLVTADDSQPETLAGVNGSGNFTMRFKVNGASIWSRGGNMIPMEELEGRSNADAYRYLVSSARLANMNTLRVWGGGIFYYDAFYDACDEMGLMLYHDMMYAQGGHWPTQDSMQTMELQHQIRRLSHHPSIVIWDGCNECGGQGLFASFVVTTVASEDTSRPVWPSCPSRGWLSGVDRLTGLPNGQALTPRADSAVEEYATTAASSMVNTCEDGTCTYQENVDYNVGTITDHPAAASPEDCCSLCTAAGDACQVAVFYDGACWFKPKNATPSFSADRVACWPAGHGPIPPPPPPPASPIESHGPYQHGTGFKTPDDPSGDLVLFDLQLPPTLAPQQPTGVSEPGHYTSEFGCVSYSSFESFQPTLSAGNWSLHSVAMSQRNYPCDNIIDVYFGKQALDQVGQAAFQRQLYMCMMGTALELKSQIEYQRSSNTFGVVIWQLGEIWPTGGWGSLEYGTPVAGQVIGGRWKPVHYWLANTLFQDVLVACGADARCYLRNDDPLNALNAQVNFTMIQTQFSYETPVFASVNVALSAGPASTAWFCLDGSSGPTCPSLNSIVAKRGCSIYDCILQAYVTSDRGSWSNMHLLTAPKLVMLSPAVVNATVTATADPYVAQVEVHASLFAMFVTLTTEAHGYFGSNAFTVTWQRNYITTFTFFGEPDMATLQDTLRVEHLQMYQS
eukprot:TRINITY_DN13971_c0_g1_i1.p1 TRINITY_DN13971_c0_g1~~TRINITY_DN13971_c0_g1_i1.p1  ORF type:complete len:1022 (-),score=216.49 TRINITY_DN13971_c0_g1_i1:104-3169(-)